MAGPGGREVGRVSIRVLPDTSAFGRSLEKFVQRMERSFRVEIPTVVDSTGFTRDVKRLADEAGRVAEVKFRADIDADGLNAKVAAIAKRASGKGITLKVDVDRNRITGALGSLGRLTTSLAMLGGIGAGVTTAKIGRANV